MDEKLEPLRAETLWAYSNTLRTQRVPASVPVSPHHLASMIAELRELREKLAMHETAARAAEGKAGAKVGDWVRVQQWARLVIGVVAYVDDSPEAHARGGTEYMTDLGRVTAKGILEVRAAPGSAEEKEET